MNMKKFSFAAFTIAAVTLLPAAVPEISAVTMTQAADAL